MREEPGDQTTPPASRQPSATEHAPADRSARRAEWIRDRAPGLVKVTALAILATVAGSLIPMVGPPIVGIALGMAVQWARPSSSRDAPGISFAAKYVLQAAVVALGMGLSLGTLLSTGAETFPVMIGTLLVALLAAAVLSTLMRVDRDVGILIGAGTAICGGSAIAATSSVIGAGKQAIVYAMSTIFVFNALAVLAFPPLGNLLELSPHGFGVWAGTAINDTSSVVAAAYSYDEVAGDTSVVVKLARTTMIIPMTIGLAIWEYVRARRSRGAVEHRLSASRLVPWFIVWFCVASTANSLGLVPEAAIPVIDATCLFLITVALTAVGMSSNFRQMKATGPWPLVMGGVLWICVVVASLVLQRTLGIW